MIRESIPHIRAPRSTREILNAFVLASVPAVAIGTWNLGYQTFLAVEHLDIASLLGWRGGLLQAGGFSISSEAAVSCFSYGLLHVLPLMAVALATSYLWERLFSSQRQRRRDPAWFMSAWLFTLLLPPSTPLLLAGVAMSFGAVIGSHIFGGTGRYLVSPALVGVLFLHFSYPGFTDAALPLAGVALESTWGSIAADAVGETVGFSQVFWGAERGAIGTVSSAACLLAATYLMYIRAASHRTILGAVAGLVISVLVVNQLGDAEGIWQVPWYWHLVVGNFAFAIVFLATDPTTTPLTATGRWLHGILIGFLTVMLRVVDPSHPEGTLFAVLLAGLSVPLIDHLVVRVAVRRVRKRPTFAMLARHD